MKSLKVAILCPGLGNKGGSERIILLQAKELNADIYAGRYYPGQTFQEFKKMNVKVLLDDKYPRRLGSFLIRMKFKRLKLKGYDAHIYHGGHSLAAARNHKNNIWYCHAPQRWLYDLYEDELKKFRSVKKQLFKLFAHFLRKDDQENVKHIDKILANSKNVKQRVKKYYNRGAEVVYPPVNLNNFRYKKFGDFFLSAARVDPIKRIDLIVKSFQKMPDKKLVICSGGPDLEKIKKMAEGHDNIKVLGWITEKKLYSLFSECLATIYMGYQEDFGMVPVESMAAGKPCIGANEGGLRESIIHKKTGLLVEPKEKEIIKAVKWMTKEKATRMKKACQQRAKKFSEKIHVKKIKAAIKSFS